MRLGAILAGGRSRRFGSDKAEALLAGRPLLEHVRGRLAPQVDALVVIGRDWPGLDRIDDAPAPNLGPLGGLLGALRHGAAQGFDDVLTAPCDCPDLPYALADALSPGPAIVADSPVLGLWPTSLASMLEALLNDGGNRSLRRWAQLTSARPVTLAGPITNLNTPDDLEAVRLPADRRSSR